MANKNLIPLSQAVETIKTAILQGQYEALKGANRVQLAVYYGIGKYLSKNTRNFAYGTGALKAISQQLRKEMPGLRGFSAENMRKMRMFYEEWADVFENRSTVMSEIEIIPFAVDLQPFEFRSTLWSEIGEQDLNSFLSVSFSNHRIIFAQEKDITARWFYIRKCATEFWECYNVDKV
jgi:hypothetical protein